MLVVMLLLHYCLSMANLAKNIPVSIAKNPGKFYANFKPATYEVYV